MHQLMALKRDINSDGGPQIWNCLLWNYHFNSSSRFGFAKSARELVATLILRFTASQREYIFILLSLARSRFPCHCCRLQRMKLKNKKTFLHFFPPLWEFFRVVECSLQNSSGAWSKLEGISFKNARADAVGALTALRAGALRCFDALHNPTSKLNAGVWLRIPACASCNSF